MKPSAILNDVLRQNWPERDNVVFDQTISRSINNIYNAEECHAHKLTFDSLFEGYRQAYSPQIWSRTDTNTLRGYKEVQFNRTNLFHFSTTYNILSCVPPHHVFKH